MLALITLGSHELLTWAVIGLVAGALAGRVVYGGGFGCFANIAVGLAGAVIGGLLLYYVGPPAGFIGSTIDDIVVSFIGAVVLLGLLRLITGGKHRRPGR